MANGRAKIGGEQGMNGEFYAGGQFLPSTQLPKRGAAERGRRGGPVRALVAPGILAEVPEGKVAIFAMVRAVCDIQDDGKLRVFNAHHPCWNYHNYNQIEAAALAYNNGERFLDVPANNE